MARIFNYVCFISVLSLQKNYDSTAAEKETRESFLSLLILTIFITIWFPKIQTRKGSITVFGPFKFTMQSIAENLVQL